MQPKINVLIVWLLAVFLSSLVVPAARADMDRSIGQTIYVPAYSHVYHGNKLKTIDLTATVSLRNVDPVRSIMLIAAEYYSEQGKPLKQFVAKPFVLPPLATAHYTIKEADRDGGATPFFLVSWRSDEPALAPLAESVMIGAASTQGISFVCFGHVIAEGQR